MEGGSEAQIGYSFHVDQFPELGHSQQELMAGDETEDRIPCLVQLQLTLRDYEITVLTNYYKGHFSVACDFLRSQFSKVFK